MRVTRTTADKFEKCAEIKGKTKVALFEDMVEELAKKVKK